MIRVLIVDDSPIVRQLLRRSLEPVPWLEAVASAGEAWRSRQRVGERAPDGMTLDSETPAMGGPDFLRQLMAPLPVTALVVTANWSRALEAEALQAGAVALGRK